MTLLGLTADGKKIVMATQLIAASTVNVTVSFPDVARVDFVISAFVSPTAGIIVPQQVGAIVTPQTAGGQNPTTNQVGLTLSTNAAGATLTTIAVGE